MGGKKSSSSGLLILIAIVLYALFHIPKWVWVIVGIGGVLWLAYYLYTQATNSKTETDKRTISQRSHMTTTSSSKSGLSRRYVDDDNLVSVPASGPVATTEKGFRIPTAPKEYGVATWVPRGQSINIAGTAIPGGMIYVGTSLKTPYGDNDSCLIDPSKSVSSQGDYTESQMGYWPSYSEITPSARRAYLNWLADGRKDPEADIGFVFLFFYGLERRAIIDGAKDVSARADWPTIGSEIRRLLNIYGEKSNSFRRYASVLLDWVSIAGHPDKLYKIQVPEFARTFELPLYIRLALGQAAVDGAPIPPHLALAWAKYDPNVALLTPAKRCNEQFNNLFPKLYSKAYGEGIVIRPNRTKLKLVYQPASSGLRGYNEIKLSFGEIPDVTAVTAPLKKLQQVIDATTKELEPYSRYIGKNHDAAGSLEGLLLLPILLWPDNNRVALQTLATQVRHEMVEISFHNLLSTLGANSAITKDRALALARVLAEADIGIEPDILGGAKVPMLDSNVVLFNILSTEVASHATPPYQAALLTLQLASAVASVDGVFSDKEMNHLRDEVQSWSHLTQNHRHRLLAHLRLLEAAPASLASLKKKFEPLDASAKQTIAAFMATVAQSDGMVSPEEVKMLEKIYKALDVDPDKVFSDVHAVASGSVPTVTTVARVEASGFKLDAQRIAALQQDTEKVSVLLAGIFKEEETIVTPLPEPDTEDDIEKDVPTYTALLGLDESHTAFARMLLSRPNWSRSELLDLSADLDLMLDGALECINEASFDTHDIPFSSGDDPIEINEELMEVLAV